MAAPTSVVRSMEECARCLARYLEPFKAQSPEGDKVPLDVNARPLALALRFAAVFTLIFS